MNFLRKLDIKSSTEPRIYYLYKHSRSLYSSSVLGLDSFVERRYKIRETFENPEIYKSRLKKTSELKNKGFVFSYDIMNMVHLVDNEEELDTLEKLLKKFCAQTKIKVVKSLFGSEVMRLYYLMNKPSEAIELVKDPLIYSELENITSFVVLLDLLYENQRYEDVVQMYEYHLVKSYFSVRSYLLNIFYFAACYKLNTETSLKKAVDLWKTLSSQNQRPGVAIKTLFAALLLKQNKIVSAMDVLQISPFNTVAENLKCLGLVMCHRFYDAFDKMEKNTQTEKNFLLLKEVFDYIEKEISSSNEEIKSQFLIIKQGLITRNLITDKPLDKYLCEDLKFERKEKTNIHKKKYKTNYSI